MVKGNSNRNGQRSCRTSIERLRGVVCVCNAGYEASLERHKIYRVLPDADAARHGDLRVIDESGEDYLYPAKWFVPIEVPAKVKASLASAA